MGRRSLTGEGVGTVCGGETEDDIRDVFVSTIPVRQALSICSHSLIVRRRDRTLCKGAAKKDSQDFGDVAVLDCLSPAVMRKSEPSVPKYSRLIGERVGGDAPIESAAGLLPVSRAYNRNERIAGQGCCGCMMLANRSSS